jgi:S1-C subfamily serine protease
LQRGDLIVNINGSIVQNVDDLQRFLSDWPMGRPLEIQALRGQERRILAIVAQEATK